MQPPHSLLVSDRGWVYRDVWGRRWLVRDVRAHERPIIYRVPDSDVAATHRVYRSHDGFRVWEERSTRVREELQVRRAPDCEAVASALRSVLHHMPVVGQAIDRRDRESGRLQVGPALDDPRRAQTQAAAEIRRRTRERRHWDTT